MASTINLNTNESINYLTPDPFTPVVTGTKYDYDEWFKDHLRDMKRRMRNYEKRGLYNETLFQEK